MNTMREQQHRPVLVFLWDDHDRHSTATRLALIGVPVVALLAVFGLPPIDLHGPFHYLGVMAPTCGMTRGVMWLARGDVLRAVQFNPAAPLVIPAMAFLIGRAIYGLITGRWSSLLVRWRPLLWLVPVSIVMVLAVNQQLSIDFLLANPGG